MGYYADGSGSVTFSFLDKKKMDMVVERLDEVFHDVGFYGVHADTDEPVTIDFYGSEKYYEDDVIACLEDLVQYGGLTAGELEYVGEDYSIWRFLYVPEANRWVKQYGRVVYGN